MRAWSSKKKKPKQTASLIWSHVTVKHDSNELLFIKLINFSLKIIYLLWDHIGEVRHIPPVIYGGIYNALGIINLFSSYHTILFSLKLIPRFQPGPGTALGLGDLGVHRLSWGRHLGRIGKFSSSRFSMFSKKDQKDQGPKNQLNIFKEHASSLLLVIQIRPVCLELDQDQGLQSYVHFSFCWVWGLEARCRV